jgi:hypothetical protein
MRGTRLAIGGLLVCAVAACGPTERDLSLKQLSLTYTYVITPSIIPPISGEPIKYTIVVRDRETRQPIQNGEGRIFAQHIDGPKTWDGFVYGPEVGTYHATLNFVLSGPWAIGIQFHRDSLSPIERTDWHQDVNEGPDSIGGS